MGIGDQGKETIIGNEDVKKLRSSDVIFIINVDPEVTAWSREEDQESGAKVYHKLVEGR